jgi:hypothetical protein
VRVPCSVPAAAGAAAATAAFEVASLRTARERVPGTGTTGASSREAAQVGRAAGGLEAGQSRDGLSGLRSGLVGGGRFHSLSLQVRMRLLREDRGGRQRAAEVAIHKSKGHPRVGGAGTMDGPPGRKRPPVPLQGWLPSSQPTDHRPG